MPSVPGCDPPWCCLTCGCVWHAVSACLEPRRVPDETPSAAGAHRSTEGVVSESGRDQLTGWSLQRKGGQRGRGGRSGETSDQEVYMKHCKSQGICGFCHVSWTHGTFPHLQLNEMCGRIFFFLGSSVHQLCPVFCPPLSFTPRHPPPLHVTLSISRPRRTVVALDD